MIRAHIGEAAEIERHAIVAWLRSEAEESRLLFLKDPTSEMAELYASRSLYYQQASGYILRGEHLKEKS